MDTIATERSKLVKALPFDRKELARRAKCSPGTLSDWINNKRGVREHLHDAIMREINSSRQNSGIEMNDSESETKSGETTPKTFPFREFMTPILQQFFDSKVAEIQATKNPARRKELFRYIADSALELSRRD